MLFNNEYCYIIIPLIAIICSQVVKFLIEGVTKKRFSIARLLNGSGGMPSTHTTAMCSLLFTIMYKQGASSVNFAIMLVITLIVMYDAMGVRMDVEKISRLLNKKLINDNDEKLRNDIGHHFSEVIGGIIFSFIVVSIFYLVR